MGEGGGGKGGGERGKEEREGKKKATSGEKYFGLCRKREKRGVRR